MWSNLAVVGLLYRDLMIPKSVKPEMSDICMYCPVIPQSERLLKTGMKERKGKSMFNLEIFVS